MIAVYVASLDDVDALVMLEGKLFREDAGVHDVFVDVTWPNREGAADFARLIASPTSLVLSARAGAGVVGLRWLYGRAVVMATAGDTCITSFVVSRRAVSTAGPWPADGRAVPIVGTPAGLRRSHRCPLFGERCGSTVLQPHGIRRPKHLGSTSPVRRTVSAAVLHSCRGDCRQRPVGSSNEVLVVSRAGIGLPFAAVVMTNGPFVAVGRSVG